MSRSIVSCRTRGTSWHPDVFLNASKVILCGWRNTCAISLQAQHFGGFGLYFAWQAQRFRGAVLHAFLRRAATGVGRAPSSGDNVQIPWHAWHFVRCAEH